MEAPTRESLHCPDCGALVSEEAVRCEYCHSVLSRASCPACLGPMFLGMRFCPRCGAPAERTDVETGRPLPCPRCGIAMTTVDLAGTRIRECTRCGGILVRAADFQRIVEDADVRAHTLPYPVAGPASDTSPEESGGRFYVPCPECGELMNRKNFSGISGIVLDACRSHGLWFDRKELQDIADFVEKGGLEKARKVELEELRQEQDRLKSMQEVPEPGTVGLQDGSSFLDSVVAGSVAGVVRALVDRFL